MRVSHIKYSVLMFLMVLAGLCFNHSTVSAEESDSDLKGHTVNISYDYMAFNLPRDAYGNPDRSILGVTMPGNPTSYTFGEQESVTFNSPTCSNPEYKFVRWGYMNSEGKYEFIYSLNDYSMEKAINGDKSCSSITLYAFFEGKYKVYIHLGTEDDPKTGSITWHCFPGGSDSVLYLDDLCNYSHPAGIGPLSDIDPDKKLIGLDEDDEGLSPTDDFIYPYAGNKEIRFSDLIEYNKFNSEDNSIDKDSLHLELEWVDMDFDDYFYFKLHSSENPSEDKVYETVNKRNSDGRNYYHLANYIERRGYSLYWRIYDGISFEEFPNMGWGNDFENQFENGKTYDLYAVYKPTEYKLSYNLDGGEWPKGTKIPWTYTLENEQTLPEPVKEDYNFIGWMDVSKDYFNSREYTMLKGNKIPKDSTGNYYLKAIWELKTYDIDILLEGEDGNIATFVQAGITENINLSKSFEKVREDYPGYEVGEIRDKISGNKVEVNWDKGTVAVRDIVKAAGDNYTLTLECLKRPITYTVTYRGVEGASFSSNTTTYTVLSDDISIPNPSKQFFEFTGWSDGGSEATTNYVIKKGSTGDKVLAANWKGKEYILKLDYNRGLSEQPVSLKAAYGSTFDLMNYKPLRDGYSFIGWGTAATSTDVIIKADVKSVAVSDFIKSDATEGVTLYALWSKDIEDKTAEGNSVIIDTDGLKYYDSEKLTITQLKKNLMVVDKKTSGKYKITKLTKKKGKVTGGTVEYVAPCNKKAKKVSVPNRIKLAGVYFKVTSVGKNACKGNKKLKSVTFGTNVTVVGANAFNGCSKLKSVKFKTAKIKKIGKNAFKGINKKAKVKVPKKVLNKYRKKLTKAKLPKTAKVTK